MSEFVKIWDELEKVRNEARKVTLKVVRKIIDNYWDRILNVAKEYDLEPKIGIELDSTIYYRPVLYFFTKNIISEMDKHDVIEKLGDWINDARLHIIFIHENTANNTN